MHFVFFFHKENNGPLLFINSGETIRLQRVTVMQKEKSGYDYQFSKDNR